RHLALEHRRSRDDDRRYTRARSALEHRVKIVMEARVREIRANVGEIHAASIRRRSCSARDTPPAARLSEKADPAPTSGATSHSRKTRRPPVRMKSTRAAQFTPNKVAMRSAVFWTCLSTIGTRRGRRKYLRAKE